MRLNPSCIREILLAAEDVITYDKSFHYQKGQISKLTLTYTHDEILYHISQAKDAGLITTSPFYDSGEFLYITDITPYGHEFLANIRPESVWDKIKALGTPSLPILLTLAKDFALAYYQKS